MRSVGKTKKRFARSSKCKEIFWEYLPSDYSWSLTLRTGEMFVFDTRSLTRQQASAPAGSEYCTSRGSYTSTTELGSKTDRTRCCRTLKS